MELLTEILHPSFWRFKIIAPILSDTVICSETAFKLIKLRLIVFIGTFQTECHRILSAVSLWWLILLVQEYDLYSWEFLPYNRKYKELEVGFDKWPYLSLYATNKRNKGALLYLPLKVCKSCVLDIWMWVGGFRFLMDNSAILPTASSLIIIIIRLFGGFEGPL